MTNLRLSVLVDASFKQYFRLEDGGLGPLAFDLKVFFIVILIVGPFRLRCIEFTRSGTWRKDELRGVLDILHEASASGRVNIISLRFPRLLNSVNVGTLFGLIWTEFIQESVRRCLGTHDRLAPLRC